MFRIAPDGKLPMVPPSPAAAPPLPPDPAQDPDGDGDDDAPSSKLDGPMYDIDKVDPDVVHYLDPDKGPFVCGNCCYFDKPNACHIVSGPIDSQGVCNLYCPPNHDEDNDDDGSDASQQLPGPDEGEPNDPNA